MVLIFTLVILILMIIGGTALIRSMGSTNLIAGNMAFQQSAVHSADTGVETALTWLEGNNAISGVLFNHLSPFGYRASSAPLAADQTGEKFWNDSLLGGVCYLPVSGGVCSADQTVVDPAGNNVAFMIQRLCSGQGDPTSVNCEVVAGTNSSSGTGSSGNNEGAGEDLISSTGVNTSVYYRITVRVTGPRSTTSFIQSIVSM